MAKDDPYAFIREDTVLKEAWDGASGFAKRANARIEQLRAFYPAHLERLREEERTLRARLAEIPKEIAEYERKQRLLGQAQVPSLFPEAIGVLREP